MIFSFDELLGYFKITFRKLKVTLKKMSIQFYLLFFNSYLFIFQFRTKWGKNLHFIHSTCTVTKSRDFRLLLFGTGHD
jgi:hypothetical protein